MPTDHNSDEQDDEQLDDEFDDDQDVGYECPYCGEVGGGCGHLLGGFDHHFCAPFEPLPDAAFDELDRELGVLGLTINEFAFALGQHAVQPPSTPQRLQQLVHSIGRGEATRGFADYMLQLALDTGLEVASTDFIEEGGPGFTSRVQLYWAVDVPAALAGIRERLVQDDESIRQLLPGSNA